MKDDFFRKEYCSPEIATKLSVTIPGLLTKVDGYYHERSQELGTWMVLSAENWAYQTKEQQERDIPVYRADTLLEEMRSLVERVTATPAVEGWILEYDVKDRPTNTVVGMNLADVAAEALLDVYVCNQERLMEQAHELATSA